MPKKINQILNIIIGAFIGVFIGHAIYQIIDFSRRPTFYQTQSAPWHTGILLRAVVTAIAVGIAAGIKMLMRNKKN